MKRYVLSITLLFISVTAYSQTFTIDDKGIVKCTGANPGDKGTINGVTYEAVDRALLIQRRDQNVDLTKVCVSNVTDMSQMFLNRQFNQNISNWDVSSVTNMRAMFFMSQFNQPIDNWDVSSVTNMSVMFSHSHFNQPIGNWDVSSVTDMRAMFDDSQFNQPIGYWDVGNVTDMNQMFFQSRFNQPLGDWDVGNVTDMKSMFSEMYFNQPIGNWNVSNVADMNGMFQGAWLFNQPINKWCVTQIGSEPQSFSYLSPLTPQNKPKWGTCPNQVTDLENGTVSDIDGKVYKTIQLGTQLWMESNLRVSRFNDGTVIPQITLDNPTAWSTNDTGAWSYYDDNVTNNALFGKLYNFYVVDNEKNICPTGWEVPSDAAWTKLSTFLGSDAGKKMKSTSGWRDGGNGTNSSGFNAVPAGRKGVTGTSYTEIGQAARFWSSTENNQNNGWIYRLTYDSDELQRDYNQKGNGFSIRCVYSTPVLVKSVPEVETLEPDVTSSTAMLKGRIVSDGNDTITNAGFCLGTTMDPDTSDHCVTSAETSGDFESEIPGLIPETTYYYRAFAENAIGKTFGQSVSFTTSRFVCGEGYSDIEGKVYTTVQIGDQCWMSQNLRVSRFNDGTVIPEITLSNPVAWSTNDTGAWSFYNDDATNNSPYGKLYNFYVVDNSKNVCPLGWKVPTDEEWGVLSTFLGADAGRKMKSTSGWRDSGNGTNSSGFNAFPAGRKGVTGTEYTELLMAARFWSSTENNQNNGWIYRMTYQSDELQRDYNQKGNGFSIRCMLDPASSVSIDEARAEIPSELELLQNYPNPFNPTTQIRFALPESQQVTIRVYDVNGRMIAELVNNQTYSAGNHQVTFDGTGLSTGVYIYNLTTNSGFTMSRKLVLVK